jgi:hypothetical protein
MRERDGTDREYHSIRHKKRAQERLAIEPQPARPVLWIPLPPDEFKHGHIEESGYERRDKHQRLMVESHGAPGHCEDPKG